VLNQVARVFRVDMLGGLRFNLADNGIELVQGSRCLPLVKRCLGCIQLGEQTAGDALTVNVPRY
jgi:hypothetical protein